MSSQPESYHTTSPAATVPGFRWVQSPLPEVFFSLPYTFWPAPGVLEPLKMHFNGDPSAPTVLSKWVIVLQGIWECQQQKHPFWGLQVFAQGKLVIVIRYALEWTVSMISTPGMVSDGVLPVPYRSLALISLDITTHMVRNAREYGMDEHWSRFSKTLDELQLLVPNDVEVLDLIADVVRRMTMDGLSDDLQRHIISSPTVSHATSIPATLADSDTNADQKHPDAGEGQSSTRRESLTGVQRRSTVRLPSIQSLGVHGGGVKGAGYSAEETKNTKFKCPHCDFIASRIDSLKRHNASKHIKEKTFKCERCPKTFVRKDMMIEHQNRNVC